MDPQFESTSHSTEKIKHAYLSKEPLYKGLMTEIEYEIKHALNKTDIKYHSVTARVKHVDSLIKKVENRQISDPFREIPDLVGARIVTLFLSDIPAIIELMKSTFDVSLVDNKIDDTDPRLFGYFSVHLHAQIRSSFTGTRYDAIKNLAFEIQIRTIAMDAWASASHYLDYKSDADIPVDLKRDFNALSGLFYLADKHFEMFFRARKDNLIKINDAIENQASLSDSALNLDILLSFLTHYFPGREQPDGSDAADLLGQLRSKNIGTLAELKHGLDSTIDVFLKAERISPPYEFDDEDVIGPTSYTATGAVRICLIGGPGFPSILEMNAANR